jgi:hypothetical protein
MAMVPAQVSENVMPQIRQWIIERKSDRSSPLPKPSIQLVGPLYESHLMPFR